MTDESKITKAEFLSQLGDGWRKLQAFIHGLTDEQLTHPTDAAGWTVKDHLIHLAVWENGMNALVERKPRYEAMGLSQQEWDNEHFDALNAIIQRQHKELPLPDVLKRLNDVHSQFLKKLQPLSDTDLQRPYNYYQSNESSTEPVIGRLIGNTYHHYDEHLPWMQAIAGSRGN